MPMSMRVDVPYLAVIRYTHTLENSGKAFGVLKCAWRRARIRHQELSSPLLRYNEIAMFILEYAPSAWSEIIAGATKTASNVFCNTATSMIVAKPRHQITKLSLSMFLCDDRISRVSAGSAPIFMVMGARVAFSGSLCTQTERKKNELCKFPLFRF